MERRGTSIKPKRVIKTAEAVDRAGRKVGVMKTFDDGSKVQENLNGTVIEIALDGTRTQTNKDGTVIRVLPRRLEAPAEQGREGSSSILPSTASRSRRTPTARVSSSTQADSGCGCLGL